MGQRDMSEGAGGVFILDAEQTPKFNRGGPYVPTLITHGTIVRSKGAELPKIMTASEHLIAMGEPLYPASEHSKYRSFVGEALENLPPLDKKRIAGNAFDAYTMGLCMFYWISNFSLKDQTATSASSSSRAAD